MSQFISRRRFMENSLLSMTVAAGAAYSASIIGAQQTPSVAGNDTVSKNDKIGIAIIGTGGRGRSHIGYFKSDPRCTILYLVDPAPKQMPDKMVSDIAASQGGIKPKCVPDLRTALEDASVDAISCASTNHWHALTGIWALQAGKHAFLEKPLTHNINEGLALEAAVKKYKKVIQTGTQCRSYEANIDLVKFVHSGGIGEVKFARGICYKRRKAIGPLGEYPVPDGVDYDLWSGPAPMTPPTRRNFHYDWHWQRLYGNGDLGNQGPHQTDVARWILGLNRYPNAIISYGGRLGYDKENPENNDPDYVDAGDTANTEVSIYDYGDKCIVFETRGLASQSRNIPAGADPAGSLIGVIAYGTKGYAVQGNSKTGQTYASSAVYGLDGNLIKAFKGGSDGAHYRNFVDAIYKDNPAAVTADATCGALSAAVSHLGNISYYLGEKNKVSVPELKTALKEIKSLDDNDVTVDDTVAHLQANKVDLDKTPLAVGPLLQFDPKAVRFVGNDEANAMLTREYRAPYVVPAPENV